MDLNELNRAATILPIQSLKELKVGEYYKIAGSRRVIAKYGSKIAADIENTFVIIFPQRIVTLFQADEDYYQELIREIAVGEVGFKLLGSQYNYYDLNSSSTKQAVIGVELCKNGNLSTRVKLISSHPQ